MARLVWCEIGEHYWEREPRPGPVPNVCPEHAKTSHDVGLELWCEAGQHSWRRPRSVGRPPTSCPEHSGGRRQGGRWIGDLKTCFLLEDGWGFKVHVNRFHLKGRGGWRMPVSLADSLGLSDGETRSLKPIRPEQIQEVPLTRTSSTLSGGSIEVPLRRLGAIDGDHAFFCIRGDRYSLVLRSRREVRDADALTLLLWSCGLDPDDETVRHSPWKHLARALGGGAGGKNEVRRRLEVRKDSDLIDLLDRVDAEGGVRPPGWIEAWQYRSPILDDDEFFVLEGGEHGVRVALGVADVSGHLPRDLIASDGGLLWLEQPSGFDPEEIEALLKAPPASLIPAARKPAWSRWLRAEHVARLGALTGDDWRIERNGESWSTGNQSSVSLLVLLETVGRASAPDAVPPAATVRKPYPRSTMAMQRALDAACRKRLHAIRADATFAFVAEYAEGSEARGCALLDVVV